MNTFINHFGQSILGVLSGFDRLVFRGHLQSLTYRGGMLAFLSSRSVLLKDFMPWATKFTEQIRKDFIEDTQDIGQKVEYLRSPSADKEAFARKRQKENQIKSGVVAALSCVEPCRTWKVHKNREMKMLVPEYGPGQCIHLYRYLDHQKFGFMHIRLQTWFPFTIQVCMNGREFLRRSLDRKRISYEMRDNCFASISNWGKAQDLINEMLKLNWINVLNDFSDDIFPSRKRAVGSMTYQWSTFQSEWATDLAFKSTDELDTVYPRFIRHALNTSDAATVLRFLGKKVTASGSVHGKFDQEVTSRRLARIEGTCVKHHVGRNSAKFYNKQGSIFRAETTINDPSAFKVYRETQGQGDSKSWLPMRASVVDLNRRADVSQQVNERLLGHLATISDDHPLESLLSGLSSPADWHGEQIRGLDLMGKDRYIIDLLADPAGSVAGIRNRDVCTSIKKATKGRGKSQKQLSGMATRTLRLLRAHGIIKKVTKTHRYQLTKQGVLIISAVKSALSASTEKLIKIAA